MPVKAFGRDSDDANCENWYPLGDWKIYRDECKAICVQAGLPTDKSCAFTARECASRKC